MIPINERSPEANEPLNLPNNSNFNKLTVKPVNQANPNCLTTDTHQITVKQSAISEHKIINTDAETKEILASIKTVFSYPEFTKLCNLDNQQLAAEYLNNILQQADTRTKRKWILQKHNIYYPNIILSLFSSKDHDYCSLLTKAVYSNNQPICKVLLDNLESNSYIGKLSNKSIDYMESLESIEDLSSFIVSRFFLQKYKSAASKEKKTANINDYTTALYLYQRILPTIKDYYNIGTYYILLCNILSCCMHIDIINLIYKDILSLDKNLVCESLSQPKNIANHLIMIRSYHPDLLSKDLAKDYLTKALMQVLKFFIDNGYENEKSYILDILKETKYTEGSFTTNAHVQDIKTKNYDLFPYLKERLTNSKSILDGF
jgi:hypothetical protein